MTTIQAWVAGVLDDALPDRYVVRGYWWAPESAEPGRVFVSVYRRRLEPAPVQGARQHDLTIDVMSSIADPARSDAELDDALFAVLDVVDTAVEFNGLTWTEATRGVIDDVFPAYSIAAWCITPKSATLPEEP